MRLKKLKWTTLRILFLSINIPSGLTFGLLAFVFAPIISYGFFNDFKFWKYTKYYVPMAKNFWMILYRNVTDKQYRAMFEIPLTSPPMTGPDRNVVQPAEAWTAGTKDCNTCQRCCTIIECPLLDQSTGLCRSYNSFFWRYFNCGRYPLNQKQIDYYGCPKWELVAQSK